MGSFETQHLDACKARRVPGRLPLRIIEVGGNRDHRPTRTTKQTLLRPRVQQTQDEAETSIGVTALADAEANDAIIRPVEVVLEEVGLGRDFVRRPTHEALDARERHSVTTPRLGKRGVPDDLGTPSVP